MDGHSSAAAGCRPAACVGGDSNDWKTRLGTCNGCGFVDTDGGAGLSVLGLGQKPIVMPHYPHMMLEDADVWTEYLKAPLVKLKQVWYDVHVGAGVKVAENADEITKKIAAGVTRKRIDVVAEVGGGYWVIEIKPFGGYVALGQALTYVRLFTAEYSPMGQVWPVIISREIDPDIIPQIDALGVVGVEI